MPNKDLNPAEKFVWTWRRGRMSDFRRALIHLIQRADVHNLEKLRLGFPDEVEGYVSYRLIPGWWDDIERRMADEQGLAGG
ncbi:MAG: hypothetical protein V3V76_03005 [Candidatus Adiutricales bacterium]